MRNGCAGIAECILYEIWHSHSGENSFGLVGSNANANPRKC